jgi:hypothetical protein
MTKEEKRKIDKYFEHRMRKINERRFPHSNIITLIDSYDLKKDKFRGITDWEYSFIQSIRKKQKDKLFELSTDQLNKCWEIWNNYHNQKL